MGCGRSRRQVRPPRRQRPPSQATVEKLLAREREESRRLDRRLAHTLLAARLLSVRRPEARALIAVARSVVDRWERERLCSRHYIRRWRVMLRGPVPKVVRSLLEPGDWQDALFQTTPWAFALGDSVSEAP
jgi:hypothetical protein